MLDPLNAFKELKAEDVLVNSTNDGSITYGDGFSAGAMAQFNRKLGNKGRNITLRADINYSDNDNKSISTSRTSLYQMQDRFGNDSTYYTNRYNLTPTKSWSYSLQATYSEPILQGRIPAVQLPLHTTATTRATVQPTTSATWALPGTGHSSIADGTTILGLLTNPLDNYLDDDLSRFSEYRTTFMRPTSLSASSTKPTT